MCYICQCRPLDLLFSLFFVIVVIFGVFLLYLWGPIPCSLSIICYICQCRPLDLLLSLFLLELLFSAFLFFCTRLLHLLFLRLRAFLEIILQRRRWKSFASLVSWLWKKSWVEIFDMTLQFGFYSFKIAQPMMAHCRFSTQDTVASTWWYPDLYSNI